MLSAEISEIVNPQEGRANTAITKALNSLRILVNTNESRKKQKDAQKICHYFVMSK